MSEGGREEQVGEKRKKRRGKAHSSGVLLHLVDMTCNCSHHTDPHQLSIVRFHYFNGD